MFYKPNYCCNCGEKIERIDWYAWTNRRFCEICETEYQLDDWIKRILPTLFLLFGILGIGTYFQGNGNSVDVSKSVTNKRSQSVQPLRPIKSNDSKNTKIENEKNKNSLESQTELLKASEPSEQSSIPRVEQKQVVIAQSPQNKVELPVYFCGAKTKKGTPCSRRVKGGGRCWQHEGREALLPENELIIGSK